MTSLFLNTTQLHVVIVKITVTSLIWNNITVFIPGDIHHPLKCVQWPILLGGALARMFGGS